MNSKNKGNLDMIVSIMNMPQKYQSNIKQILPQITGIQTIGKNQNQYKRNKSEMAKKPNLSSHIPRNISNNNIILNQAAIEINYEMQQKIPEQILKESL